jgi:hypothetical protein
VEAHERLADPQPDDDRAEDHDGQQQFRRAVVRAGQLSGVHGQQRERDDLRDDVGHLIGGARRQQSPQVRAHRPSKLLRRAALYRLGPMDPDRPLALLLLPRPLEAFILRDQAEDLLRAPGVVAADPAKVPYGAFGRMPEALAVALARGQAKRLLRALPGTPRVVVIFHPFQLPIAAALLERLGGDAELWYGRWDRYEAAHDAGPKLRERLQRLHDLAAGRAALTFVASDALGAIEAQAGRPATLVPLSADAFPAPDPTRSVVAVSLGHLGRRVDWRLLRELAERMPELTGLMIGERHDDEVRGDPDFAACAAAPNLIWLGRRSDEEAARLIGCADVGIVPFTVEPFNDAGLPYRILKYARQGRRTVTPELAGVRTWDRAVLRAPDVEGWIAALRSQAGVRARPDLELREWALGQRARVVNRPLFERLEALGIESGRLGSERLAAEPDAG